MELSGRQVSLRPRKGDDNRPPAVGHVGVCTCFAFTLTRSVQLSVSFSLSLVSVCLGLSLPLSSVCLSSVCLSSVCLSVCLSIVCLSIVCLSIVCLSIRLSVYRLSVCLSPLSFFNVWRAQFHCLIKNSCWYHVFSIFFYNFDGKSVIEICYVMLLWCHYYIACLCIR